MVGHGRPITWSFTTNRIAARQIGLGLSRLIFATLTAFIALSLGGTHADGAEKTVRLRLAWGSGAAAEHKWTGSVSIDGAVLSDLQPLGLAVDAPVANRIDGERLVIDPLVKRSFDGCDMTVRADDVAKVRIELGNEQMPEPQVFEATLQEVVGGQLQQALDDFGSYFLARRSPGDELRMVPTRDHLVFEPGEMWQLRLQPDLESHLVDGPLGIELRLQRAGDDTPTWQASQQINHASQLAAGIGFDVPCPLVEGAYRVRIAARHEEGFATRFVPGQQSKPIVAREIEFVVVDPNAKLPPLVDQWVPVLTIDPANPSWWQRLPAWAQVPRLRDRTSGALGNIRPVVRPTPTGDLL